MVFCLIVVLFDTNGDKKLNTDDTKPPTSKCHQCVRTQSDAPESLGKFSKYTKNTSIRLLLQI